MERERRERGINIAETDNFVAWFRCFGESEAAGVGA